MVFGGRGGGFKIEGLTLGENVPGPCLQPAPTYPPLEHHPTPLTISPTSMAQLASKLYFLSSLPKETKALNYPWEYFPYELRPGTRKRKIEEKPSKTPAKAPPVTSIDQLLADLEKTETARVKVEVEEEEKGEEEEGELEFEESDEEMDDGTDYNQNYFDNGEGYLEEDDDMDDGPTY